MSNPSRAKGTRFEVELLDVLRDLHGEHVERAPLKGTSDAGDFVGVPYLVEAKNTKVPKFLEWTRQCRRKAKEHRNSSSWILVWKGDRRTLLDPEPLVVMPLDLYVEMAKTIDMLSDDFFGARF